MDRNVIAKKKTDRKGRDTETQAPVRLSLHMKYERCFFKSIVVGFCSPNLKGFVPEYLSTAFSFGKSITILSRRGVSQSNAMPRGSSKRRCCSLHVKPLMFANLFPPEDVLDFHLYMAIKLSPGIALPPQESDLVLYTDLAQGLVSVLNKETFTSD